MAGVTAWVQWGSESHHLPVIALATQPVLIQEDVVTLQQYLDRTKAFWGKTGTPSVRQVPQGPSPDRLCIPV